MRPSQVLDMQLLDAIQWSEPEAGTLVYRYPMLDMEIQTGATLTVRDAEMAVFVDEGRIADVIGPGVHALNAAKLPLLTGLKNRGKGFESPFRADIYFFSTRGERDQKWGTPSSIPLGDKKAGAILLRSYGSYSYRIADPRIFFARVSGTRESYFVYDLDDRLRRTLAAGLEEILVASGAAYPKLIADAVALGDKVMEQMKPAFAALGLELSQFAIQAISFEDDVQPLRDQRMGAGASSDFGSTATAACCDGCGASMRTDHGILKCDYCHTVVVTDAGGDEDGGSRECDGHACPVCEIALMQATVGGASLLYCTRCDGMLMAMEELQLLIAASRALPGGPVQTATAADMEHSIACPRCRSKMSASYSCEGGNVAIDSCESCGLNWLDHGKLARIAHASAPDFGGESKGAVDSGRGDSRSYFTAVQVGSSAGLNMGA